MLVILCLNITSHELHNKAQYNHQLWWKIYKNYSKNVCRCLMTWGLLKKMLGQANVMPLLALPDKHAIIGAQTEDRNTSCQHWLTQEIWVNHLGDISGHGLKTRSNVCRRLAQNTFGKLSPRLIVVTFRQGGHRGSTTKRHDWCWANAAASRGLVLRQCHLFTLELKPRNAKTWTCVCIEL